MITAAQLKAIIPGATQKAIETFLPWFNKWMPAYHIDTPRRIAAFIAQVAHESGSLNYVREIASGNAYEGRKDLGNVHPGDGSKFKGRGLIQLTGRNNYYILSMAFYGDDRLTQSPDLLTTPDNAVRSACWYWDTRKLNVFADMPEGWRSDPLKEDSHTAFQMITLRINGGFNGYDSRLAFYRRALLALTPQVATSKTS